MQPCERSFERVASRGSLGCNGGRVEHFGTGRCWRSVWRGEGSKLEGSFIIVVFLFEGRSFRGDDSLSRHLIWDSCSFEHG